MIIIFSSTTFDSILRIQALLLCGKIFIYEGKLYEKFVTDRESFLGLLFLLEMMILGPPGPRDAESSYGPCDTGFAEYSSEYFEASDSLPRLHSILIPLHFFMWNLSSFSFIV